MMKSNSLYIIGTPLGNLEDITLRAQKTFRDLKHFFAEDTRELSKLFNLLGISLEGKKLHSYASHNMKEATEFALKLLDSDSIGLVSDRGMPAISDPGAYLVQAARDKKIPVVPIPGPSAVTTLIAVSGVQSSSFHFVGFLPQTQKQREELWKKVKTWPQPLCFFESPKRIQNSLQELALEFPEGKVCVGREMTKQFEEFLSFNLRDLSHQNIPDRGEFTVVLDPGDWTPPMKWEEEVQERLLSDKEWAKRTAARAGCAASEVYNALQRLKNRP